MDPGKNLFLREIQVDKAPNLWYTFKNLEMTGIRPDTRARRQEMFGLAPDGLQ
jgi:hypothetical protein